MRNTIGLLLLCIVVCGCSNTGKRQADVPVVGYDEYVWLEANTYENLIDNGLRCFGLTSIGLPWDSCIRLWIEEPYYPKRTKTHYFNLFQFDVKRNRPYATYYSLEWQVKEGKTPQGIVTCVRKAPLQPKSGWGALKTRMEELQLNRIDTISIQQESEGSTDGDLMMLQYVYGETTITVDFSTYGRLLNSKSEKNRKYFELVKLVKDEFSVNLFADHSGYDGFKIYTK